MDTPVEPVIRPARPGDGAGLARIWLENARYYIDRFPDDFRLPEQDGLAERFARPVQGDAILLVAEVAGDVAAYAYARVSRPEADAAYQYLAPYTETRAHVEALGTGDAFRRRGLATRLVEACEQWARELGATQIGATTYAASEVSVPFWEERMGYRRRGISFVKRLEA